MRPAMIGVTAVAIGLAATTAASVAMANLSAPGSQWLPCPSEWPAGALPQWPPWPTSGYGFDSVCSTIVVAAASYNYDNDPRIPCSAEQIVFAYGWPWRAFQLERATASCVPAEVGPGSWRYGLRLQLTSGSELLVPLMPRWSGLCLNTLVYAAILFPFLLLAPIRRSRRRRHGVCTRCGYPVRSRRADCSECGSRGETA
jgi:hypothetical protein